MGQVSGRFEGAIAGKSGTNKFGKPWTMYSVMVDGKKWSAGFDQPKAALGDTVTFETEQKGEYENIVKDSFRVTAQATAASKAASSGPVSGSGTATYNDPKQSSIETQSSISAASRIVAAQIHAGVNIASPADAVASLVDSFLTILHPKPKVAKAAPKPAVMPEDDFEDALPPY